MEEQDVGLPGPRTDDLSIMRGEAEPARHTPGPWMLSGARSRAPNDTFHVVTAHDSALAFVTWSDRTDEVWRESLADARLIAAAPELLENLRFAVKLLSPWAGGTAQVDAMRAAIAKAEGRA